jgi:two-component system response regulator VicR
MADGQKTILIIEDDKTLLEMYRLKFEAAGFAFLGAATGEEGITLAETKQPDLILVDLLLENKVAGGKIGGFAVLEELKANGKTKTIPMYALTNLNQESDVKEAFKLGADGYLVKSDMTPKELIENAQAILRGEKVGIKQ